MRSGTARARARWRGRRGDPRRRARAAPAPLRSGREPRAPGWPRAFRRHASAPSASGSVKWTSLPSARRAAHADLTPVRLDDLLDEAEPGAADAARGGRIGAVEARKELCLRVGAQPLVAHRDAHPAVAQLGHHHDLPAVGRVLRRVRDQVAQRLAHPVGVGPHAQLARRQLHHVAVCVARVLEHRDRLFDQRPQRERVARLDPGLPARADPAVLLVQPRHIGLRPRQRALASPGAHSGHEHRNAERRSAGLEQPLVDRGAGGRPGRVDALAQLRLRRLDDRARQRLREVRRQRNDHAVGEQHATIRSGRQRRTTTRQPVSPRTFSTSSISSSGLKGLTM